MPAFAGETMRGSMMLLFGVMGLTFFIYQQTLSPTSPNCLQAPHGPAGADSNAAGGGLAGVASGGHNSVTDKHAVSGLQLHERPSAVTARPPAAGTTHLGFPTGGLPDAARTSAPDALQVGARAMNEPRGVAHNRSYQFERIRSTCEPWRPRKSDSTTITAIDAFPSLGLEICVCQRGLACHGAGADCVRIPGTRMYSWDQDRVGYRRGSAGKCGTPLIEPPKPKDPILQFTPCATNDGAYCRCNGVIRYGDETTFVEKNVVDGEKCGDRWFSRVAGSPCWSLEAGSGGFCNRMRGLAVKQCYCRNDSVGTRKTTQACSARPAVTIKPRIAVVTYSDNNTAYFGGITAAINQAYCDKMGYDWKVFSEDMVNPAEYDGVRPSADMVRGWIATKFRYPPGNARHPAWNKYYYLLKELPSYDYVMWIDTDVSIVHQKYRIEDLLMSDPDADIFIGRDMGPSEQQWLMRKWEVNSGMLVVKNSDWAKHTINFMLNDDLFATNYILQGQRGPNLAIHMAGWDQAAFRYVVQGELAGPFPREHVRIVLSPTFNNNANNVTDLIVSQKYFTQHATNMMGKYKHDKRDQIEEVQRAVQLLRDMPPADVPDVCPELELL